MWGQVMKYGDYYLFVYRVPHGVHGDSFLKSGYSMVIAARCVASTHDKILCDDVYQPRNMKLSGMPTTYVINSTEHYNDPLSVDYRGCTFELTLSYMHAIQRITVDNSIQRLTFDKNKK